MLHVMEEGGLLKVDPLVFINNDYGTWPTPVDVSMPFGEWHHLAVTYDGTGYKIYVDGELKDGYDRINGGELDHSDAPVAVGKG